MKTTLKLLLMGIVAAFCSSIASAQTIIYSNAFNGTAGVLVSNTAPTYDSGTLGATAGALWEEVLTNDTHTPGGSLMQDGNLTSTLADYDSWFLPFTPQNGYVYVQTTSITFTNNPNSWSEWGFNQSFPIQQSGGDGRWISGSKQQGMDFVISNPGNQQNQFFYGPATTPTAGWGNTLPSGATTYLASTGYVNVIQVILDTTGYAGVTNQNTGRTNWTIACYINGVECGVTNYTYTPSNQVIAAAGIGLGGVIGANNLKYNYWALGTELKPYIIEQPFQMVTNAAGQTYSNRVVVSADPVGGTLGYQWYVDGVALVNGVNNVSGANTNVLVINPVETVNQATNYYCVVSNNYGSDISLNPSMASAQAATWGGLLILTNPVSMSPAANSNAITLFGGSDGNFGSSPSFSISAVGAPPMDFRWYTNGVATGVLTLNNTASGNVFTNLQATGPTTFACVVSNSFGTITDTWYATYISTPTAAYPQDVLSDMPLNFWRLNEPDDGSGNQGVVCHDYQSGNNGAYTNVILGATGYDPSEPTETCAEIAAYTATHSYIGQIGGQGATDFGMPSGNAEFTVEAWAAGYGDAPGSAIVTEGTFNLNDEFNLGSSTNVGAGAALYQFYVRAANGTVYRAVSHQQVSDTLWHHLVGVCDEAGGKVTLYVDGIAAAVTAIPANSGIIEPAASQMVIGANIAPGPGQTDYGITPTNEFPGNIADVAIYKYPLSVSQVITHYVSFGNAVAVFGSIVPTNYAFQVGGTITIPALVGGSADFGYYWSNTATTTVIASGSTSASGQLDATLTIPSAPYSLSGEQLELVVTNASSSTNWFCNLISPVSTQVDYTSPILYSNSFVNGYGGATWNLAGQPATVANVLVGGTNSLWVDSSTNDAGLMPVNGSPTSTTAQNSWTLPFKPHAGYVYTLSIQATFFGAPASWLAAGFGLNVVTNGIVGSTGKINGGATSPDGIDWMLWQQSGAIQYFTAGANIASPAVGIAGNVTHSIQIILDTTGATWTGHAVIDGTTTQTGNVVTTNLHSIIIAQNGVPNNNVQWNNIMLTQVAPGGVPPYLLDPQPSTSPITLTNGTVAIGASAFGSAPLGYYWTNTATIASGSTNSMAPLLADLSVSSSSLSVGQLELVVTNAYGTSTTIIPLLPPILVPTNSAGITGFSLIGTDVAIDATNGLAGGTYYLLGSTNIATPLNQWLPVATNVVNTNGDTVNGFTFNGTNAVNANNPQTFYILSNTNDLP